MLSGHTGLLTKHRSGCHLRGWCSGKCAIYPWRWNIKLTGTLKMNMKASACEEERKLQLQELEELRLEAFDSAMWYKERTKLWHGKNLRVKELRVGKKVLLFQSAEANAW